MENSELQVQWSGRLKEYECSRKTLTAWCREQGFSIHQAKYWQRKLRRTDLASNQSAQWVTFEIEGLGGTAMKRRTTGLCIKIGSAIIEIQPGYNADLLKDVIRTLGTLC